MPRRAVSSGDSADPRLGDLEYMRKGPGLVRSKLAARPRVLALTGTDNPDTAYDRIEQALEQLASSDRIRALQNAFGLGLADRGTLSGRRQTFAAKVGRSADAIRDWEDQAIGELLLYLAATYQQLPQLPNPRYLITELRIRYVIRNRRYIESRQWREIISLIPEAPHFRYGTSEPAALANIVGGSYQLDSRGPGGDVHRIVFPRPLTTGERQTFSFIERRVPGFPQPAYELVGDFAGQTFEMPARHFRIEVQFEGEHPNVIWHYSQMHRYERPGKPYPRNRLRTDATGRVRCDFFNMYGGFGSGIAWRW